MVTLAVNLEDKMETPAQNLEPGEFIVRRVVELSKLKDELAGKHRVLENTDLSRFLIYVTKRMMPRYTYIFIALIGQKETVLTRNLQGCIVDARLSHFADGLALAARIHSGEFK